MVKTETKRFSADLDAARFTKLQVHLAMNGLSKRKFLEKVVDNHLKEKK